jgi:hypothetical protein
MRLLIVTMLVTVAIPCAAQPSSPANQSFCRAVAAEAEAAHAVWDDGYDPIVMTGIYDRTYRACLIVERAE